MNIKIICKFINMKILLWGMLFFFCSSVAYAQQETPYEQEAELIVQKAVVDLAQQGKLPLNIARLMAAYHLLAQARKVMNHPPLRLKEKQGRVLCLAGRLYSRQGEWLKAYGAYRRCLPLLANQRLQKTFHKEKDTAFVHVGAELKVQSEPSGVTVHVLDAYGENQIHQTPFRLSIAPGSLQLHIKHAGYQDYRSTIFIAPKASQVTAIKLEKIRVNMEILPHPRRNVAQSLAWGHIALATASLGTGLALLLISQNDASEADRMGQVLVANVSQQSTDIYQSVNESFQPQRRAYAKERQLASIILLSVTAVAAGIAIGLFVWNGGKPPQAVVMKKTSVFSDMALSVTEENTRVLLYQTP